MSGCEVYQIIHLDRFTHSYELILKNHYSKKRKRLRSDFEEQVNGLIDQIKQNPCSNVFSLKEPFPKDCANNKFEFRKIRFRPFGLDGSSSYGRFMYVVCKDYHIVYLLWIYTHEEFSGKNSRPSDKELSKEFEIIQADISLMSQSDS